MSVQQWRRKPSKPSTDVLSAAQYEPGKPLSGVIQVAKMATEGRVAVAYLPRGGRIAGLPDVPVLVAACVVQWGEQPARTEYTVVPPGDYLIYDEGNDDLASYTGKDLADWYDLEGEK